MSNPSVRLADVLLTFVLDAKKNRLIETVLLSIHTICFGREIRTLKALKSQCNIIYMYMPNYPGDTRPEFKMWGGASNQCLF